MLDHEHSRTQILTVGGTRSAVTGISDTSGAIITPTAIAAPPQASTQSPRADPQRPTIGGNVTSKHKEPAISARREVEDEAEADDGAGRGEGQAPLASKLPSTVDISSWAEDGSALARVAGALEAASGGDEEAKARVLGALRARFGSGLVQQLEEQQALAEMDSLADAETQRAPARPRGSSPTVVETTRSLVAGKLGAAHVPSAYHGSRRGAPTPSTAGFQDMYSFLIELGDALPPPPPPPSPPPQVDKPSGQVGVNLEAYLGDEQRRRARPPPPAPGVKATMVKHAKHQMVHAMDDMAKTVTESAWSWHDLQEEALLRQRMKRSGAVDLKTGLVKSEVEQDIAKLKRRDMAKEMEQDRW